MYLFASFLLMLVFFSSSIFFFKPVGSCRESATQTTFRIPVRTQISVAP